MYVLRSLTSWTVMIYNCDEIGDANMTKKKEIAAEEHEARTVPLQLRIKPSDKVALGQIAYDLTRPGIPYTISGVAYKIISDYIAEHKVK
jgi:hypothetical protein